MKTRVLRIAIGVMAGFIALTAIGGGMALLLGAEGNRFPLTWLEGTPFKDYTIPALLLVVAVGGSALAAAVLILRSRRFGAYAGGLSGLVMMGYITVEALILKQVPPGPTGIEIIYFTLGLLILLLSAWVWKATQSSIERSQP